MKAMKCFFAIAGIFIVGQLSLTNVFAEPVDKIEKGTRCSVCGMFVDKYANWVTEVRHKDGTVKFFDGVKDMMVYYFNPADYGPYDKDSFAELWVKDYYSLKWQDARTAFYAVGSDVKGPMGPEFIPFSAKGAAETFMKDHHADKILTFGEIKSSQVEAMRHGNMMKMKMK